MSAGDGTFDDRIGHLADSIGWGDLVGTVEFDQIYAQYVHNRIDLNHPGGGQAFFLTDTLLEREHWYLNRLELDLFRDLRGAMIENMEDLAHKSAARAPVRYGNLHRSDHPIVTDRGAIVYDRAPAAHRLTEYEIVLEKRLAGGYLARWAKARLETFATPPAPTMTREERETLERRRREAREVRKMIREKKAHPPKPKPERPKEEKHPSPYKIMKSHGVTPGKYGRPRKRKPKPPESKK